jgi:hypothetical protein
LLLNLQKQISLIPAQGAGTRRFPGGDALYQPDKEAHAIQGLSEGLSGLMMK